MTPDESVLWKRISEFPLDAPGASNPFSAKLQRENRWSASFTMRVIEEYRRFAFLSVVAGHMVSPSDAVDQAWHRHLFYTQSYWTDFCQSTLGKKLHHNPSQGGNTESAKYDAAYVQTLESYQRFFGEPAPTEIWPASVVKQSERHDYVRVDRQSHWVVPKLRLRPLLPYAICVTLVLALIGCAGQSGSMNPFDLDGPGFLVFFGWAMAFCWFAAFAVRYFFRPPFASDLASLQTLTPVEIAALAGSESGCLASTVNALVLCGSLQVHPVVKSLETINPDVSGLNALAAFVVEQCKVTGGRTFESLKSSTLLSTQAICERLVQKQLLLGRAQRMFLSGLVAVVAAAPLLVGIPRIIGGASLGHPVEYLATMCLFTCVVALIFALGGPRRTLRGDAVLRMNREKLSYLRSIAGEPSRTNQDAIMAVALFGIAVMPVAMQQDMRQTLAVNSTNSGSCSSGGCSGGGCSGGGCGGGGCGG